jgi:hypothetical protein
VGAVDLLARLIQQVRVLVRVRVEVLELRLL